MKIRKLLCMILAMLLITSPAMAAKKSKSKRYVRTSYRIAGCQNGSQSSGNCNGTNNGCSNSGNCAANSGCTNNGNCSASNGCTNNSNSGCANNGNCSNNSGNSGSGSNSGSVVTGIAVNNENSMANEVIRQTNMERAKVGLGSLKVSSALTKAACIRAGEIVKQFSHTRPDGTKWSTVSNQARGENIAKGHNSADRVMAAWMTSQGHKANILRSSFGSIGVCAYKVNNVVYWVQLFGN